MKTRHRTRRLRCEALEQRRVLAAELELIFSASTANEADAPAIITATLSRLDADTTIPLSVTLTNDGPTELWLPDSITIPANQTSVVVNMEVVNDGDLDGTRSATVTASATDFVSGSDSLAVSDDDVTAILTLGGKLSGTITADTYQVVSDLVAPHGKTLSIAAGSVLEFAAGQGLRVDGTLTALGTAVDPIQFTSAAAEPTPGDWSRLTFSGSNQPRSLLDHVQVAYAEIGIAFYPNGGEVQATISNSDIAYSSTTGIHISTGLDESLREDDVTISTTRVHHNLGSGILIEAYTAGTSGSAATPLLQFVEVDHNGSHGIEAFADAHPSSYSIPRRGAGASPTVVGSWIHHNAGTGITAYGSRSESQRNNTAASPTVRRSIIEANGDHGLAFDGASSFALIQPTIANNVIANNAGSGLWHGSVMRAEYMLRNNVIVGNAKGVEAAGLFTPAATFVSHNNVYNNAGGDWVNYPSSFGDETAANANGTPADAENNLSIDPKFVAIGDYHLKLSSPLVNAGTATNIGDTQDIDGDAIIAAPEIGIDEIWYLQLSLSHSRVSEGIANGTVIATLKRTGADVSSPLNVAITNPDSSDFVVPTSVVIPAGQSQATFPVNLVDDSTIEPVQNFWLRVQAPNYRGTSASIGVGDNEYAAPIPTTEQEYRLDTPAGSDAAVARQTNGGYVTVFSAVLNGAVTILARRFGGDDQPIGDPIVVDTLASGWIYQSPRVASDAQGNFVVVWPRDSNGGSGSAGDLFARRFLADGTPRAARFKVSTSAGKPTLPAVAMSADGAFTASWNQVDVGFLRRYDANGVALGGEMQFTVGSESAYRSKLAYDAAGNLFVVWDQATGSFSSDIFFRRYLQSTDVWTDPFKASITQSSTTNNHPNISVNGSGQFLIAWITKSGGFGSERAVVRRFSSAGLPLHDPLPMTDQQSLETPQIALHNNGDFTVATTQGFHVYVQQFTKEVYPKRPLLRTNQHLLSNRTAAGLVWHSPDRYTVVWNGRGPGNVDGVFARQFVSTPPQLAVDMPPETTEATGSGVVTGTVTRIGVNTSAAMVVNLSSNDTSELRVPATVTIPAGQTSATFNITVPNDNLDDGSQVAKVTATFTGYRSGSDQILIRDDDRPVLALPTSVTFVENALFKLIAPTGSVSDRNNANFNQGQLTVRITAGWKSGDQLFIRHQGNGAGQIGVNQHTISYEGVPIGTWSGGSNAQPLVVDLNADASRAAVVALIRNLAFVAPGDDPGGYPRTIRAIFKDGTGGISDPKFFTVNVSIKNDPPKLESIPEDVDYRLNSSLAVAIAAGAEVSDADHKNFEGGKLTVRITSGVNGGNRIDLGGSLFRIQSGELWRENERIGLVNTDAGIGTVDFEVTFTHLASPGFVQQLLRALRFRTIGSTLTDNRGIRFVLEDGDGGTAVENATVLIR